jgi:protein TonB
VSGRKSKRRHVVASIFTTVLVGVGGGLFLLVRTFLLSAPAPAPKLIEEVHLIRPPPPPDTPPPPPPPEEKVDVQQPTEQPDPTPTDEPPPSQQLGLDAEGGAGSDAFGLLGNKGGREITASGGSAISWYAGLLKNEITEQLTSDKEVRSGQYAVTVRVWVRPDGSIDSVRIVQGSGDRVRDRAIENALNRITRLSQAPPPDMPEPINLRIVSHG